MLIPKPRQYYCVHHSSTWLMGEHGNSPYKTLTCLVQSLCRKTFPNQPVPTTHTGTCSSTTMEQDHHGGNRAQHRQNRTFLFARNSMRAEIKLRTLDSAILSSYLIVNPA